MMRPGDVSLFLLVIGCATAAGQAVPAERSEGVLKAGEKVASSASPTMLEGFLKTQSSSSFPRRRKDYPPSGQRPEPASPRLITAQFDVLRDEAEAYARRLQAAGVAAKLRRYDGMIDRFIRRYPFFDQGRAASRRLAGSYGRRYRPRAVAE